MSEATEALLSRFEVTTSMVAVDGEELAITRPRDAELLIDEAAFNRDERLPYWADVWPSSIALARGVREMPRARSRVHAKGRRYALFLAGANRCGFHQPARPGAR